MVRLAHLFLPVGDFIYIWAFQHHIKRRSIIRLVKEVGNIEEAEYEHVLKTLDCIEVDDEGNVEGMFLGGDLEHKKVGGRVFTFIIKMI